jgi:hypothetical protein
MNRRDRFVHRTPGNRSRAMSHTSSRTGRPRDSKHRSLGRAPYLCGAYCPRLRRQRRSASSDRPTIVRLPRGRSAVVQLRRPEPATRSFMLETSTSPGGGQGCDSRPNRNCEPANAINNQGAVGRGERVATRCSLAPTHTLVCAELANSQPRSLDASSRDGSANQSFCGHCAHHAGGVAASVSVLTSNGSASRPAAYHSSNSAPSCSRARASVRACRSDS